MRPAIPATYLGEQDVALGPQGREATLERAHPLPNAFDSPLQLGFVEHAEVVWHGHECTATGYFNSGVEKLVG